MSSQRDKYSQQPVGHLAAAPKQTAIISFHTDLRTLILSFSGEAATQGICLLLSVSTL